MSALKLNVRGEHLTFPESVAKQVPFLKALLETKADNEHNVDYLSPNFLTTLLEWIKTGKKQYKSDLQTTYEKDDIKRWMLYLSLFPTVHQWYGFSEIDQHFVVESIRWIPNQSFIYHLNDGTALYRAQDKPLKSSQMWCRIKDEVQILQTEPNEPERILWNDIVYQRNYSYWYAHGSYFVDWWRIDIPVLPANNRKYIRETHGAVAVWNTN